jgi:transposase
MLYLGIDQHRKQLTVCIRNERGDVILKRQVSTEWKRLRKFFAEVRRLSGEEGYVVVVEVCGFNDWLLKLLEEEGCQKCLLVQPAGRSKKKTDRRDANVLSETLWVNRERLLAGKRVQGLRVVLPASAEEGERRQLTALRKRIGQLRTRTLNKVQRILLKHNLQRDCPTKGLQTQGARKWLAGLSLGAIDRLELDQLLAQWELWDEQLKQLDEEITRRIQSDHRAQLLGTIVGSAGYGSLVVACRIGPIERFPRPASLANYWGLTPGCRNSGDATDRLGSITKEGSAIVRFVLGQWVLHVLRRDPSMRAWYTRIKKRRGSKIARVAVMRRLATIIWHMVKNDQPYVIGGPARLRERVAVSEPPTGRAAGGRSKRRRCVLQGMAGQMNGAGRSRRIKSTLPGETESGSAGEQPDKG